MHIRKFKKITKYEIAGNGKRNITHDDFCVKSPVAEFVL